MTLSLHNQQKSLKKQQAGGKPDYSNDPGLGALLQNAQKILEEMIIKKDPAYLVEKQREMVAMLEEKVTLMTRK